MKLLVLFCLLSTDLIAQYPDITFTRQVNNNDHIYQMDDQGKLTQVTNHPRKDSSPMISPDSKSMVFTSERVGWWKIWIMNLENGTFKQLTQSSTAEYSPSWSPDGQNIVFVSSRNGQQDLFVMNMDGAQQTNITNTTKPDMMPFWASDDRIYYSSKVDGHYQILSCNPDGTMSKIITTSPSNKMMPQLSNDRKSMLYYGDQDGNLEIYVLKLIDRTISRLTNHPLMDMRPRWSADNLWIVFERGNKGNNHHIYIMKTDGSDLKQLTFKNYNYAPSFVRP